MPRRDKKKRKKTKKSKLSTEEILKLLKKLKPKTSQNVRVNVGDAKGGKSSYTPPFVVPQQQPSISYTFAGQPLSAPMTAPMTAPTPPTAAPLVPKKPAERKPKKVVAMATPITDTEADDMFNLYSRKTFKEPPQNRSGNLSSNVSAYSRLQPSSQYTQYPSVDLSAPDSDEIGTMPNSLPQDQWTGSPDGTSVPYNEMLQNQAQMDESGEYEIPTPEEAFAEEEQQAVITTPRTPSTQNVLISTPQQKRIFIEQYIERNNRVTPIPKQFLVSIGGTRKGTLKKAITDRDINSIYELAKQDIINANQI
jgi:hypothetical protein